MTEETPQRDLVSVLVKALRQLGDAGKPEDANRLAAQAWWALKDQDPRAAEHVNGVMHYLARLEASVQPDTPPVTPQQAQPEASAAHTPPPPA